LIATFIQFTECLNVTSRWTRYKPMHNSDSHIFW